MGDFRDLVVKSFKEQMNIFLFLGSHPGACELCLSLLVNCIRWFPPREAGFASPGHIVSEMQIFLLFFLSCC